ncbi:MAG: hypothetical protein JWP87_3807 [Labilithrix sp.]|nr:hypothetical protein [Labilithrix sp.]
MKAPFEIEWLGGVAEKHFRRLRPATAALPWGTLEPERYPARLVERARNTWTQIAISEYRAAMSFAEMLRLLLEVRAPLDLVGMAGDFVADEVSHVEIASRIAMELGGGVSIDIDTSAMLEPLSNEAHPLQRTNDRMLVTAIHETFSESNAIGTMRASRHPLLRSALEQIARDEARHTRIGWLYFDWATELIDDGERARLAGVALGCIEELATVWQARTSVAKEGVTSEGFLVEHVHELGFLDSESFVARSRACIARDIVPPLAERGIVVDATRLAGVLR